MIPMSIFDHQYLRAGLPGRPRAEQRLMPVRRQGASA
jgi:hypothetical protein